MARDVLDRYYTPTAATRVLVDDLGAWLVGGVTFEPCCGEGAIVDELRACSDVLTNDASKTVAADYHMDASLRPLWDEVRERHAPTRVVTNPPFSFAPRILPLAHDLSERGMAHLLRLSFLEPCNNRSAWLCANPPTRLIVLPRISFTGDGGVDTVTCAWMVWDKTGTVKPGIRIVQDFASKGRLF